MGIKSTVRHALKGPLGDPSRHLDAESLTRGLAELPPPPKDRGSLGLVVARNRGSGRETPERVRLTPEEGVPGDLWAVDVPDRPEMQLAVMRLDVATLLANGQSLSLFGDNLLVDLDLSGANLPAGSRVRLGNALLEVTPKPHNGCIKFRQRFGGDALRLTANPKLRDQHLRGIYMRVLEAGEVAAGDAIQVLSRALQPELA